MNNNLFFELIRVSIATQNSLSRKPSAEEWQSLYAMAKMQSLVGLCFAGVRKLVNCENEDYCGMPEMLYFTWMGMAAKIQQRNELMDDKTKESLSFFREKGFPCQVLKGQGIASLYGDLRNLRQSGDIDVWLNGNRDSVYQLSLESFGCITGANYHHIHFPMWQDVEVEAHIYPSFLSCPRKNRILHEFCNSHIPTVGCDDNPSLAFNRVYILLHCYRHVSGHGVGFRQLLDYYYVLSKGFSEEDRKNAMVWINRLGMERFAHAFMWVCKEVFHLDDKFLICSPDEKYGRFLLDEVLATGNMGHSENRLNKNLLRSAAGRYLYNLKRDLHIMKLTPHESIWDPFFDLWLFLWRKFVWGRKYRIVRD